MKQFNKNFLEIISNKISILIFIISLISISYFFYYFTDLILNIQNLGINFVISEIILEVIISILFAMFITSSIYKFNKFNKISLRENISGSAGSFLGILVVGCPACSITFASYFGLAGFIALIPGYGIGLKLISIPVLMYSNYSIIKNLNICKIKSTKN